MPVILLWIRPRDNPRRRKVNISRRPVCLNTLAIPRRLRVAVLAPHPDDFDAAGVTLRLFHENGNRVALAVLGSGWSGVEDGFRGSTSWEEKARVRQNEQTESCRFFGLPPENLSFLRLTEDETGRLADIPGNLEAIRRYLSEQAPHLAFLPHGNDTNRDHRLVWSLARRAALELGLEVTAFLIRDPKTVAMRLDAYTEFDEAAAAWKGRLLRFHGSQHQRNLNTRHMGFDERILRVNRQAAQELGISAPYAEAFELDFWGPIPGA